MVALEITRSGVTYVRLGRRPVAVIKLHPRRTKQISRSLIYPIDHSLTLLALSPGKGNSTACFGTSPRWESPNSPLGQCPDEDAWRDGLEA